VIACFVDIGGIVDHHCLNLQSNCRQGRKWSDHGPAFLCGFTDI